MKIHNDTTDSDEMIARALQDQFMEEAKTNTGGGKSFVAAETDIADQFETVVAESAHGYEVQKSSACPVATDNDAALAKRLEQEMRDEEYAAGLVQVDIQSSANPVTPAGALATRGDRGSKRCGLPSKSTSIGLTIAVIVFLILLFFFGPRFSSPVNPLDPTSWFDGAWEEGGNNSGNKFWYTAELYPGLRLRVLNNLDERWRGTFETAISEWENGDPDALTLSVEDLDGFDSKCNKVRDAMIVCNGDYGHTPWRGVNELSLEYGLIVASVARLNDYYLDSESDVTRQYVMCHELGHGFGLGHSDENSLNADLGDCMDYTVTPENNLHPGTRNFELLEEMYGNVDGTGRRRKTLVDDRHESYHPPLSEGWTLLHRSGFAEHHERNLGNGRTMRKIFLLA